MSLVHRQEEIGQAALSPEYILHVNLTIPPAPGKPEQGARPRPEPKPAPTPTERVVQTILRERLRLEQATFHQTVQDIKNEYHVSVRAVLARQRAFYESARFHAQDPLLTAPNTMRPHASEVRFSQVLRRNQAAGLTASPKAPPQRQAFPSPLQAPAGSAEGSRAEPGSAPFAEGVTSRRATLSQQVLPGSRRAQRPQSYQGEELALAHPVEEGLPLSGRVSPEERSPSQPAPPRGGTRASSGAAVPQKDASLRIEASGLARAEGANQGRAETPGQKSSRSVPASARRDALSSPAPPADGRPVSGAAEPSRPNRAEERAVAGTKRPQKGESLIRAEGGRAAEAEPLPNRATPAPLSLSHPQPQGSAAPVSPTPANSLSQGPVAAGESSAKAAGEAAQAGISLGQPGEGAAFHTDIAPVSPQKPSMRPAAVSPTAREHGSPAGISAGETATSAVFPAPLALSLPPQAGGEPHADAGRALPLLAHPTQADLAAPPAASYAPPLPEGPAFKRPESGYRAGRMPRPQGSVSAHAPYGQPGPEAAASPADRLPPLSPLGSPAAPAAEQLYRERSGQGGAIPNGGEPSPRPEEGRFSQREEGGLPSSRTQGRSQAGDSPAPALMEPPGDSAGVARRPMMPLQYTSPAAAGPRDGAAHTQASGIPRQNPLPYGPQAVYRAVRPMAVAGRAKGQGGPAAPVSRAVPMVAAGSLPAGQNLRLAPGGMAAQLSLLGRAGGKGIRTAARPIASAVGAAPILPSPPGPGELAYALPPPPSPVSRPAAPSPAPSSREGYVESAYVQNLPAWARDFLQESFAHPQPAAGAPAGSPARQSALAGGTAGPAPTGGAAYPPLRAFQGQQPGAQTVWAAPGYAGMPAKLAHRAKQPPEPPPPLRVTDAEIGRVAGKVYQIIEERMRRDRRRLGL